MLLIVGTIRLPPENVAQARAAMQAMILQTRAEDGCLGYSYAEDVLDPGLIHIKEFWRDREAIDRHFATAHIAEWRATWPDLGVHDRDLVLYEAGNPQPT